MCLAGWDRPGQHSTGAAVWTGANVLTKYMETELSSDFKGKSVIELGAGCAIGAIQAQWLGAGLALATDGDEAVLDLAKENAQANIKSGASYGSFAVDKLYWGDVEDVSRSLSYLASPAGDEQAKWDWIIGADITYKKDTWPLLVSTIKSLSGPQTRTLIAMEPRCESSFLNTIAYHSRRLE